MLFPIVLLGIETIDLNGPGSTTPFSGFDSLNVNFIGNWPFGGSYSLAIGQSENLIFLGSGGGVYILDVSQPLQPIEISDLVRARGLLGNTRVNGFYTNGGEIFYDSMRKLLFLASGIGGIEIWNVDNPLQPQRQCRYITQGYPIDIFILGNYAFIADYKEGFLILDISNANSPTQIAFYALPEIRKVSVLGDFAYVLNGGQGNPGLLIFDLSNIANPTQIGYCPGASGTALDIQIDYPYAYVPVPLMGFSCPLT
jgi:hypothetical protein